MKHTIKPPLSIFHRPRDLPFSSASVQSSPGTGRLFRAPQNQESHSRCVACSKNQTLPAWKKS
jgi:hypothetical protein